MGMTARTTRITVRGTDGKIIDNLPGAQPAGTAARRLDGIAPAAPWQPPDSILHCTSWDGQREVPIAERVAELGWTAAKPVSMRGGQAYNDEHYYTPDFRMIVRDDVTDISAALTDAITNSLEPDREWLLSAGADGTRERQRIAGNVAAALEYPTVEALADAGIVLVYDRNPRGGGFDSVCEHVDGDDIRVQLNPTAD